MPLTKVTAGVIAANAVVDSFGTQSITGDKLGLTAINANNIVNGTITGAKIAAGTITGDDLANDIIRGNNIVAGTITGNLIAANTITGDDLGQNAVSANNIATNAIENYTALTNRPLSNRNIVINGAMTVVQRNANTTAITTGSYYSPDRWLIDISSAGTWTMNVDSVGVNRAGPSGTEFGNSCNLICTTADSSLSAGDYMMMVTRFEGLNLQQVKKGTANAESLTVSFWARSSNTGTYVCELFDWDNTRQCSRSWTINTAGTWERKVLTFPADTTGRFDNDNALSLGLNFWLVAGTTFSSGTLNTSWASNTNANRAVGQFNLAGNINNYIAITGVQMELGTVATPFEMRSYGQELALCQRYYEKSFPQATRPAQNAGLTGGMRITSYAANAANNLAIRFAVVKRAAPTCTTFNPSAANAQVRDIVIGADYSGTAVNEASEGGFNIYTVSNAGSIAGYTALVQWTAEIEL